ncbi:MAG TPA: GNAT family N-acetyltransferase [Bacteroidia bacterium]|nr:GNAT family N-acetyltransferase [Bacteroidia bacterium]
MLSLIDEVFDTRKDPNQLQVDQKVMKKLEKIHPATLSEFADEKGPAVWALVIPTTTTVMNDFLSRKISEKDILTKTKPGEKYTCIYLCSVTTLPEYRGKGESKKLCIQAINAICKDHPIETLFVWPFTKEGEKLAASLAKECKLSLHVYTAQ